MNLDETDDIVDLSSSEDVDSSSAVTTSSGGRLYSKEDNVAEDMMVEARVKDGIGDSGESERNNPGIGDVERSSFLVSSFTKVAGDVSLLERVLLLVLITMIVVVVFTYLCQLIVSINCESRALESTRICIALHPKAKASQ